jgi:hypothetical protein
MSRRPTLTALSAFALIVLLLLNGCSGAKVKPKVFSMGEPVELGHLIYRVFETQWLTQVGEGVSARVPQSRFFVIRVSVTSSGDGELFVPAAVLENDGGAQFQEVENGDQLPSWLGLVRKIKPAEPLQGNVIFDVPAAHYRLLLTDENEQRKAYVDIPLNYGAESGEMSLPESTKKQ